MSRFEDRPAKMAELQEEEQLSMPYDEYPHLRYVEQYHK